MLKKLNFFHDFQTVLRVRKLKNKEIKRQNVVSYLKLEVITWW